MFSFSLLKLRISVSIVLPRSLENEKNKSEEENVRLMQDPKRSTVTIVAAEKLWDVEQHRLFYCQWWDEK